MWDTGATTSCVNSQIILQLGLDVKGIVEVHTANGIIYADRHILCIILTDTKDKAVNFENELLVTSVNLSENILGLIGMDFIGLGSFLVNYNRATDKHTLQFSFPSLTKLNDFDFKQEQDKQNKNALESFEKN